MLRTRATFGQPMDAITQRSSPTLTPPKPVKPVRSSTPTPTLPPGRNDLLTNCADIYARCDDTNLRLCNQTFSTKVYIDKDNEPHAEHD